MSREFPESGNFSARNLWYMKQWYLFYTEESGKLKQAVSGFPLPFACVPWGHHIRIMQHSKTLEEALFYINYTINEGISRDTLSRVLKDDLYNKLGKAPNHIQQYTHQGYASHTEQLKERVELLQCQLKETKRLIDKAR